MVTLYADSGRGSFPGCLDRVLRSPRCTVDPGRVAESLAEERQHRVPRLGSHRGGRGVIEVEHRHGVSRDRAGYEVVDAVDVTRFRNSSTLVS